MTWNTILRNLRGTLRGKELIGAVVHEQSHLQNAVTQSGAGCTSSSHLRAEKLSRSVYPSMKRSKSVWDLIQLYDEYNLPSKGRQSLAAAHQLPNEDWLSAAQESPTKLKTARSDPCDLLMVDTNPPKVGD